MRRRRLKIWQKWKLNLIWYRKSATNSKFVDLARSVENYDHLRKIINQFYDNVKKNLKILQN